MVCLAAENKDKQEIGGGLSCLPYKLKRAWSELPNPKTGQQNIPSVVVVRFAAEKK